MSFYRSTKYKNHKVEVDGIVFDSKKEAKRYEELKLLEAAKEITELKRQVPFLLIPSQRIDGKVVEREVKYIADFTYRDSEGNYIVEDVKGYRGGAAYNTFKIKRKLMLYFFHIRITEV